MDRALVGRVSVAILTSAMDVQPTATLGDTSEEVVSAAQTAHEEGRSTHAHRRRTQGMEVDMNRFHAALREVRHELRDARRGAAARGEGAEEAALGDEDSLLRDSLVLLEVERTILDERLRAESALAKVLEERVRLARLLAGDPALQEVAALGRAFRRVVDVLSKGA